MKDLHNTDADAIQLASMAHGEHGRTSLTQARTHETHGQKSPCDDSEAALAHQLDPKRWSTRKKVAVTATLSVTGFARIMISTMMAPALSSIAADLGMSPVEANMSLSIFVLASAVGPLFFGPASEIYGRKWLLHSTSVWFFVWNIACGFARQKGLLIAARLLAGLGASAIYSLGAGVLSDLWTPEQRGSSLAIYMLIPLLGAGIGPTVGGFIVQGTTWRWIFWTTSIIQAILLLVSYVFFSETYLPTILKQHHRRNSVARASGQPQLRSSTILTWLRPFRFLLFSPTVQVQAVLAAFQYGLLYLVLSTYAELFQSRYGQSTAVSGLHYIALCLGELVGALFGGRAMDRLFAWLKARQVRSTSQDGPTSHPARQGVPELHIPLMIPSAIGTPLAMLAYGWSAQRHAPWIVVDLCALLMLAFVQVSGQVLQAYCIDSYPGQASSVAAALQFARSIAAFAFPLFGPAMFSRLGYGWAMSVMALVSLCISLPAAPFFWHYGRQLRLRQHLA